MRFLVLNISTCQETGSDFITAQELWIRREGLLKGFEKFESDVFIGVEQLDRILGLRCGKFVALHGRPSLDLSFLLCVKSILPQPLGLDAHVIFVDGGNVFDPYAISEHAIEHELNPEMVLERIHISRAFTYHQLTSLLSKKLPTTMDTYAAKLVIVSDMTQLYCDPDIRGDDEQDALQIFLKTVRFLRALAERKHVLILVTTLQSRNLRMDNLLLSSAHVSAKLKDVDTFTELSVVRHPWIPQLKTTIPKPGVRTLERYL